MFGSTSWLGFDYSYGYLAKLKYMLIKTTVKFNKLMSFMVLYFYSKS